MFAIDFICGGAYGVLDGGSGRFHAVDYFGEFSGMIFHSGNSKIVVRISFGLKPKSTMLSVYERKSMKLMAP
jgi:hypothetical protein